MRGKHFDGVAFLSRIVFLTFCHDHHLSGLMCMYFGIVEILSTEETCTVFGTKVTTYKHVAAKCAFSGVNPKNYIIKGTGLLNREIGQLLY